MRAFLLALIALLGPALTSCAVGTGVGCGDQGCQGKPAPTSLTATPAGTVNSPIVLSGFGAQQVVTMAPQIVGMTITPTFDATCVQLSPLSLTFVSTTSPDTFTVTAAGTPCALTKVT